ncbi:hypothetical protein OK414_29470 [Priestia sp. JV24]|uniref:hypothetical protein n=1 Tax=Priestia TaxID=2800373 RepID=UPI0021D68332|nr:MULTISPECIES: hypothetical protein [Priestia]MCU7713077.1 hypothetical protein [Priestia megaterium]MCW1049185.1 hypothetical protein [Priestia sp. JV24]
MDEMIQQMQDMFEELASQDKDAAITLLEGLTDYMAQLNEAPDEGKTHNKPNVPLYNRSPEYEATPNHKSIFRDYLRNGDNE